MALSVAVASPLSAVPAVPAVADEQSVTVLSRNVYLGADVAVALELIPDMPAAAQFMWEQVAATDFSKRAPVLAAELAREKPDVVALQEATTWICRSSFFGSSTPVFDFTAQLLAATKAAGVEYVVATHDGHQAFNPGYSIPVLPNLTTVRDPETFQPIFGSDEAACGFTIGDALLVRADLADQVVSVGSGEYESKYSVVPIIFEVDRGYTWADVRIADSTVRFVATHLESVWNPNSVPIGKSQADELLAAMKGWTMPLVVIGDFNSDPRDPRPEGAPNPGLQPDATTGCEPQPAGLSSDNALDECNAYWTMTRAGFTDVGPDALDPANATWGASALLAGPEPSRLAESGDNPYGYTDRLDYIFVKNGVTVERTALIGARWPDGQDLWECSSPEQVANAEVAAGVLGVSLPDAFCLPTDHVGLLAVLDVPPTPADEGGQSNVPIAWIVAGVVIASGVISLLFWRASTRQDAVAR